MKYVSKVPQGFHLNRAFHILDAPITEPIFANGLPFLAFGCNSAPNAKFIFEKLVSTEFQPVPSIQIFFDFLKRPLLESVSPEVSNSSKLFLFSCIGLPSTSISSFFLN